MQAARLSSRASQTRDSQGVHSACLAIASRDGGCAPLIAIAIGSITDRLEMNHNMYYLVGRGRASNGVNIWIGWRPADKSAGSEPTIVAQSGGGPDAICPALPPGDMLEYRNYENVLCEEQGQLKFAGFKEELDWFKHRCRDANCEWFVKIVERMAAGEIVTPQEIEAEYSARNGKPPSCGDWLLLTGS